MYAGIKTGGKQYKVAKDDESTIEKLAAEAGDTVQFNEVLMLGEGGGAPTIGRPLVADAGVKAEVVEQTKGEKVYNFKKRRRKHSSARLKGHRQELTTVRITEILASGAEKSGVLPALGAGTVRAADGAQNAAAPASGGQEAEA